MAKHNNTPEKPKMAPEEALFQALSLCRKAGALTTVSYTHLTLPTKRIV